MSRDPGLEALVANAKRKPGAPVILPRRHEPVIIGIDLASGPDIYVEGFMRDSKLVLR